jgi:transcriptional regulator with XRE-family HTH domain
LVAHRSQSDIAAAAGVSLPTLQRFEAGANVSVDVLVRVAFVLGSGSIVSDLFPLPEARTIEDVLERRRLPKRGRSR